MVIQQFYFEQRQSASPIESHATQPFISLGRLTNKATKAEKISAGDTMMLNTTKYTAMAVLGVGLAFAATPASACGSYGYTGYGYGSYGGCGAYGYAGYHRPWYGAYGYASFVPRYRIYRPVFAFAGFMPRYRPFGYAAYGCRC
jgi:hypothetical protein